MKTIAFVILMVMLAIAVLDYQTGLHLRDTIFGYYR
jgi:hypothetical protein